MPASDNSLPPAGSTLRQAFEALVTTLNDRRIRYAIIGGLAMIQHVRVRTTDDIDVLLTIPELELSGTFESLNARGFEIELLRSIREFRDEGLTSFRYGNVIVDLLRPVIPAFAHVLDHAIETEILGHSVRVVSPEGLVIMKLTAMRSHDEADIQDILSAYHGALDLGYIRTELDSFTTPNDPRRAKFDAWVRRASKGR